MVKVIEKVFYSLIDIVFEVLKIVMISNVYNNDFHYIILISLNL